MNAAVRCIMLSALGAATTLAAATEGLKVGPDWAWPRWQARLGLTISPASALDPAASTMLQDARLFGDYYFTGSGFGPDRVSGGFRASGGLLSGPRSLTLGVPTLPSRQGSPFTLSSRIGFSADAGEASATVPYLGVGYTGMSARGGWGFTADIGLVPSGVHLGRAPGPGNLDDLLREIRLRPVVQLGVSYSF